MPEKRREKAIFPVPKFIVLLIALLLIVTGGGIIGLVMAQHQDKHNGYYDIYVGSLAAGLGLGVETSGEQREWYKVNDGSLTLTYPADQQWGTMFITVGPNVPLGTRPSINLSAYHSLVVDLRAMANGQWSVLASKIETS